MISLNQMQAGRRDRGWRRATLSVLCVLALCAGSCKSIGPKTIPRDQFDYGKAISNSWKEQLLNNIVRLRYVEAPVFVNVSSVINQYALEGTIALGAGANTAITGDNTASIGATGRWADRPTITYTPITGKQFSISLLTPVPPESIFALVQAGWPAELILRLTVRSINGISNEIAGPGGRRQASPEFIELINVWQRLRTARALGLRRDKSDKGSQIVVYRTGAHEDPQVEQDLDFLQTALGLEPEAGEYKLSYGLIPNEPNEIAVLTMSMLELMNELAWRAEVPESHVEDGRTGSTFVTDEPFRPLIEVHYTDKRPDDQYVTVENRDHWFYVDDRDVNSKRTFAIVQILLSLTESGEAARGPVVTIGS